MKRASPTAGYSSQPQPLASYAALFLSFMSLLGGALPMLWKSKRSLPARGRFSDFLLLAIATHKMSRLLAKDRIFSPLRAPFTRYEKSAGEGEVEESARGNGMRRAIGELVTCPYCISPWSAGVLLVLRQVAPRFARLICVLLALTAGAHFLHHAYVKTRPE